MSWYRWQGQDLLLHLLVQPRASREGFVGPHGDTFKVRISAPPVDGQANAYLQGWLAKAFGVSRTRVQIIAGHNGRRKTLLIQQPERLPIATGIKSDAG